MWGRGVTFMLLSPDCWQSPRYCPSLVRKWTCWWNFGGTDLRSAWLKTPARMMKLSGCAVCCSLMARCSSFCATFLLLLLIVGGIWVATSRIEFISLSHELRQGWAVFAYYSSILAPPVQKKYQQKSFVPIPQFFFYFLTCFYLLYHVYNWFFYLFYCVGLFLMPRCVFF